MKFQVGEVLWYCWPQHRGAGREVLDRITGRGSWQMPCYKFEAPDTKSGFVWIPEWMLTNVKPGG